MLRKDILINVSEDKICKTTAETVTELSDKGTLQIQLMRCCNPILSIINLSFVIKSTYLLSQTTIILLIHDYNCVSIENYNVNQRSNITLYIVSWLIVK